MDQKTIDEAQGALAQIKAVYDDKCATINGRNYEFTMTSHAQRVKVFAYFSKVRTQVERGDMSYLDTDEFKSVERVIGHIVTYEGSLLAKLPLHWEHFPEDYLTFVSTAMGVISYPFLRGKSTA